MRNVLAASGLGLLALGTSAVLCFAMTDTAPLQAPRTLLRDDDVQTPLVSLLRDDDTQAPLTGALRDDERQARLSESAVQVSGGARA